MEPEFNKDGRQTDRSILRETNLFRPSLLNADEDGRFIAYTELSS